MYSFLKDFLVLVKLLSLSQFYVPKYTIMVSRNNTLTRRFIFHLS